MQCDRENPEQRFSLSHPGAAINLTNLHSHARRITLFRILATRLDCQNTFAGCLEHVWLDILKAKRAIFDLSGFEVGLIVGSSEDSHARAEALRFRVVFRSGVIHTPLIERIYLVCLLALFR